MKKVEIIIHSFVGTTFCSSGEDGQKLFNTINKFIEQKTQVELSFENITVLTSSFLNPAIGKLYKEYTSEELNTYLKITNISEDDLIILKNTIETAKQYYENPKNETAISKKILD